MYIIYIYILIYLCSGGLSACCIMARARATYVLNHFSRSASSSRAGSVFSVQVDHVDQTAFFVVSIITDSFETRKGNVMMRSSKMRLKR